MDKKRRKRLEEVIADLEQWKEEASDFVSRIEDIKSDIEEIFDEEKDAYDRSLFPESEQGERSQSAIDSMELAIDSVDQMADDLEGLAGNTVDDIVDYLREAIAC